MQVKKFTACKEDLLALEKICAVWSYWNYEECVRSLEKAQYELICVNSTASSLWKAVAFFQKTAFQCDLLCIFVLPDFRGHGLGKILLTELMKELKDDKCEEGLFLEVRSSNLSAIRLYKSFGMKETGTRKKYYRDGEDALCFFKEV